MDAAPGDHPPGRLREELRADRGRQVHVPRPRAAHKTQIAHAVEEIFERQGGGVRTAKVRAKPKRRGLHRGKTRSWKKAVVQLAPGERIELFEGAAVEG